jgi:ankyrin repeat protein
MTLPDIKDIKRISKVFQGLVEFIEENHDQSSDEITVPEEIQSLVLKLQVDHESFGKGIEEYMHKKKRNVSEVKTVERIIEESPYYLTVKDVDGDLPIHTAARDGSSFPTFIPLLAMVGIQHGVGGKGGKGGLLVQDHRRRSPLSLMVRVGNFDAMKVLFNAKPPLLVKSDVRERYLIHHSVYYNKLELMKMMIELDPAPLYKTNSSDKLPIHCAESLDAAKLLLKSASEYDPKHSSIGGLFSKDKKGEMPINIIINTFGKEHVMRCIEQALSTNKDIPILHKVILHTPEYIHDIITSFPDSCFLRDDDGRLPIHVALETGMKWSSALLLIMNANSEHLDEVDPVTKLCTSALAAAKPASDLRTINYLTLKYPKNLKVSALSSSTQEQQRKRQKLNH